MSLLMIQSELHAPKSQYNSFGKYSYRNCEDIMEALKPLLLKYGMTLTISDELVNIGDRYYVKSTVSLSDGGKTLPITVTAYAREEQEKKGFDAMQLTGATSSYARKFALNGMFLIDDTKDSDSTNTHGKDVPQVKPQQQMSKNVDLNVLYAQLVKKHFKSRDEFQFWVEQELSPEFDVTLPANLPDLVNALRKLEN